MNERQPRWAALAPIGALSLVSVWAWANTFEGWSGMIAGGLGVALALALVAASVRWQWHPLLTIGAGVAVYLVVAAPVAFPGSAVGGVIPTFGTLADAAVGVITSWKDLLTAEAPVQEVGTALLVPFITALLLTALAATIAMRERRAGWSVIPVAAHAAVAVGFGTYLAATPTVRGALFAVLAIAWLAFLRHSESGSSTESSGTAMLGRPASMVGAAGILTGAIVIAALAAGPVTAQQRDVLRDHVEPPLDVHQYPSPLQSFRGLLRDDSSTVLFTATGLPDGARVRLATLDMYDGTVYGVGATGQAGSGVFERVGTSIATDAMGTPTSSTFTMGAWNGVWIPDAGYLTAISFSGARANALERSVHYNGATGVAVTSAGLEQGDSYTITYVDPADVDPAALGSDTIAQIAMPTVTNIPKELSEAAGRAVQGASTDADRMIRLTQWLSETGYFSHGLAEDEQPSLSGHGEGRLTAMFTADYMIGDDEQYAVALALMARSQGIPARVVMGFYTPESAGGAYEVTATDLHAWVEVPFQSAGWVAFFPTPDASKPIPDVNEPPRRDPKPQVLQPPLAPEEPAKLPPTESTDENITAGGTPVLAQVLTVLRYVGAGAGILLVLFGPGLAVLLLKARRRLRRRGAARTSDRFAGAWDEIVDTALDSGIALPTGATRGEHARVLDERMQGTSAVSLATRANDGVFGPQERAAEDAASFWAEVDSYLAEILPGRLTPRGLKARLSLRSLAARRRRAEGVGA